MVRHKPPSTELLLILSSKAVHSANWTASYDIRADTAQSADKNIVIHYKASITQDTGEVRAVCIIPQPDG